jgi:hypothetical protein
MYIDSKPCSPWNKISASIYIFIFLEWLKRQCISVGLFLSIEGHDKFDNLIMLRLNCKESYTHLCL